MRTTLVMLVLVALMAPPIYGQESWTLPDAQARIFGLSVDSTGVYLAGSTYGNFPGFVNAGMSDIFLAKMDFFGTLIRAWQWGTPNYDGARSVACLNDTLYAVIEENAIYGSDAVVSVVALSQNGTFWSAPIQSRGISSAITIDANSVYAATLSSVTKLGHDGTVLWTASRNGVNDMALDVQGNLYVVGGTEGDLISVYGFVTSYTPDGTLRWEDRVQTDGLDRFYGVAAGASGVYALGTTGWDMANNLGHYFLNHYGFDGTVVSSDSIAETSGGGDIALGPDDEIYVTFNHGNEHVGQMQKRVNGSIVWDINQTGYLLAFNEGILYLIDPTNEIHRYDAATGGTPQPPPPLDTTPPAPPTQFTATPENREVSLNWVPPGDPDLAYCKISRWQETPTDTPLVQLPPPTSSYTDTAVHNRTRYHYRVIAVDTAGNRSDGPTVDVTPKMLGDVTADDVVDIRDIMITIEVILGRSERNGEEDLNADGRVDILDVVRIVNIVLGHVTAKPTVLTDDAGAAISFGAMENGVIPIHIASDAPFGGVQFTIQWSGNVQFGTPTCADGFILKSRAERNQLVVILFSMTKEEREFTVLIPAGFGDGNAKIEIAQAILVNRAIQVIPVTLGEAFRKTSVPAEFSLGQNRPNPFNPSTTIAYDVPRQAHITLVVYNLLGQKVIRLVDEAKTAGRYTATWDAHNVPTGVYFYRLTSSTGFSAVRKMTVLK